MSIATTQLQDFCLKNAACFEAASQPNAITCKTYRIPLDELREEYTFINIRESADPNVKEIFGELCQQIHCGPALYTLELDTTLSTQVIVQTLEKYRATKARAVSAIKKAPNTNANILYVGKVQKKFWERLVVHLGFATNRLTSGLQLFHWLRGTNSSLIINLYVFPSGMEGLMSAVETQVAQSIKPLIGKHL